MNHVLFDGMATQSSNRAAFHGGGEYAKFMLKAAIEQGNEFDVVMGEWLHTDPAIVQLLKDNKQIPVFHITKRKELYQLIEEHKYKKFYSALPAYYTDYSGTAQLIGVIHGLRAAELPWDFYRYKYEPKWYNRLVGWIISHSSKVQAILKKKHISDTGKLLAIKNANFITVSYHSKNSLLAFYPNLKTNDIKVYYSPFSVNKIENVQPKQDYFLMVSANRYEKNIYRAVKVFDKLFSDGRLQGKRVVITGCGNQPFWKEIRNKDRFDLKKYVSSEELDTLFMKAFCFVYPSLNEGFGYPPMQAMAYGTPVIASSATSIPEVCDDAASFFSPTNEDDLASRILRIDGDCEYRTTLISRGLERVAFIQQNQTRKIEEELKLIFE